MSELPPPPAAAPPPPGPSPAPKHAPHASHSPAHRRPRRERWESRTDPLLPMPMFRRRVVRAALLGLSVIAVSLGLGMVGYHITGPFSWIDSLYNASMILGGMGPVDTRALADQPNALKVFASAYALYSGVALLTSVGVMFAPVLHRVLHRFHLENAGDSD